MQTPFRPFRAVPPEATRHVDAAAVGLAVGALAGGLIPALVLAAEALAGAPMTLASPPPAVLATLVVPALLGPAGGWIAAVVAAHRATAEAISTKAASLMDEVWTLRDALERGEGPDEAAPALPRGLERPLPADGSDQDELTLAQARLLASFGEATQDTLRRMHVNLQGLRLAGLSHVQERLVDSLHGHVEGLWDLADDVVAYVDEDPGPVARPDPRSARPKRPPGRLAA
jgi:hypothetical protein